MEVATRNIKIRGEWALIKEEWSVQDNEIDCYNLASGSMDAEAWDCIKFTASPFIPHNETATLLAMQKIDKEYSEE